jgi:hypothetical protein
MSPEQIAGTEINGRSDLFSLGVILYQLLTGEKPFVGDTIPTLLYNIVNKDPTPPSQIDSSIPPLYDDVIAKALAKNPDKRYRRARDFVEDLKRAHRGEPLMEAPSIEPTMTVAQGIAEKIYPKRKRYGLLGGFAVLVLALVLGGYYWMDRTPKPTKEEVVAVPQPVKQFGSIEVTSDPPGAQVFLDGVEHKEPTPTVIEEVAAEEKHEIKVVKRGFKPWVRTVEPKDDKPLPIPASLERLLTTIGIESTPSGASVFLDGAEHSELTPTEILKVTAGEEHEIRVEKRGFKPWVGIVEPEDDKPLSIEAPLERLVGSIIVKSTPPGASVFLDNSKKSSGSTPMELPDVSADDVHVVKVTKEGYELGVQTITVKPDERREVEVALKPLMGKLKIKVRPWARVYVDGEPMGMTPLTPLELPVGEHIIQLKNEKLREERSFRVMVKPNEVHSMDVNLLKKE